MIERPYFGSKSDRSVNLVEFGKRSSRRRLANGVTKASSSTAETMRAKRRPTSKRQSATQQAIRKARVGNSFQNIIRRHTFGGQSQINQQCIAHSRITARLHHIAITENSNLAKRKHAAKATT